MVAWAARRVTIRAVDVVRLDGSSEPHIEISIDGKRTLVPLSVLIARWAAEHEPRNTSAGCFDPESSLDVFKK